MTQSYELRSTAASILALARLKAGLSQQQLANRAGVSATMISAYERDLRQPTLPTLELLLAAAGLELRYHLEPRDLHDEVLAKLEFDRTPAERKRRDRQIDVWRRAELSDVIRSKEAAGRPKDLRVLPRLYRHLEQLNKETESTK
jgi:transcriptional regulator with XRE-family HTH domain